MGVSLQDENVVFFLSKADYSSDIAVKIGIAIINGDRVCYGDCGVFVQTKRVDGVI